MPGAQIISVISIPTTNSKSFQHIYSVLGREYTMSQAKQMFLPLKKTLIELATERKKKYNI